MPEGWAWCRLKEVCTVFGRIGFRGYTRDDLVEKGNGAITLSPSNLINMKLNLTDCTYISWSKYEESPEIQLDINDVVVVKTGSSYGKTSLVDNLTEKTTLNPQLMVLKERKCNSKYLCYFLNTQYMRKHFEDLVNGTAIPTFSQEKFGMKLFPLPPASEQEKIVSRIELIFDKIDLLENDKEDLDTIIKQTKFKILDLAIHGKLVPQNPYDEPAEELLKRISTSDNRPYKKFDEEVLFEIPESWSWCYLHTISALLNGDRGENYPSKKDYVECGIPFINAGCLDNGNINYDVANYITEEKYNSLRAGKIQKGDILYCLRGSLGKTGFVITDNKGAISSSLCIFRLTEAIIPQFFLYVLNSNAIKVQQQMVDNGTAQPNLSAKDVSNFAIPIPPISEQSRIVSKIEELFSFLDTISSNLE